MIKTMEQWLTGKRLLIILTIAAAVWFSFAAVMTVLRYRLNYAPAYDFGIFSQMYYYMEKGLSPLTTCEPVSYTHLPDSWSRDVVSCSPSTGTSSAVLPSDSVAISFPRLNPILYPSCE